MNTKTQMNAKRHQQLASTLNVDEDGDWSREQAREPLDIAKIEMHYALLIESISEDSHPFMRTVVAGAPLNSLTYLKETHYPRKIDAVIAELRELRDIGTNSRAAQGSEVDQSQIERKLNWLKFNTDQLAEVSELIEAMQITYAKHFKKRWSKPTAGNSAGKARSLTSTMATLDHVLAKADSKSLTSKDLTLEGVFAAK